MAARSLHLDSYLEAPFEASVETGLDLAMMRAYPIERSLDTGCSVDDVMKLRRRVEGGASWVKVAVLLAGDDRARAQAQRHAGMVDTAAAFYLHAAACFRLAQAALDQRPAERLAVYRDSVAAFSAAMDLLGHADAKLQVVFRGAQHGAWFFRPRGASADTPCVLVWGGADGWCEAFFGSVAGYLDRGLAVCLLELPGQGLARLQDGSCLDLGFTDMVSATLDALTLRGAAPDRFGLVGHSLGGSLALRAAAADSRIRACCTNGGSVDLQGGIGKFPRVLQRVGRMLKDECGDAEVLDLMQQLALEEAVSALRTPVLCLQGGQDPLVADEDARRLVAVRGAQPTTYAYWPEGVHCLYNHGVERDCVLADWFARQLHS